MYYVVPGITGHRNHRTLVHHFTGITPIGGCCLTLTKVVNEEDDNCNACILQWAITIHVGLFSSVVTRTNSRGGNLTLQYVLAHPAHPAQASLPVLTDPLGHLPPPLPGLQQGERTRR